MTRSLPSTQSQLLFFLPQVGEPVQGERILSQVRRGSYSAWGGKKAAPASVQKGFEQGLPTPGKTPEVPSSNGWLVVGRGSGGRSPRRPIEGGAATGATAGSPAAVCGTGFTDSFPSAKGKDQSAVSEEVTELNFGAPLFQALARFLTIYQSMAILAAMFVEGLAQRNPRGDSAGCGGAGRTRPSGDSPPIRVCGAHQKGKCRYGDKCRNLHLDEEGV